MNAQPQPPQSRLLFRVLCGVLAVLFLYLSGSQIHLMLVRERSMETWPFVLKSASFFLNSISFGYTARTGRWIVGK